MATEGRLNSAEPPRPRKRCRRTVSCNLCRMRKLKCDREYPTCGRCAKSRNPEQCTYENRFLWQEPKTVTPPPLELRPRSSTSRTNQQQQSVPVVAASAASSSQPRSMATGAAIQSQPATRKGPAEGSSSRERYLDTVLNRPCTQQTCGQACGQSDRSQCQHQEEPTQYYSIPRNHSPASPSQQLDMPNRVLIRGKETRTRFNGGGIVANLMMQFPRLKLLIDELKSSDTAVLHIRRNVEFAKRGSHKMKMKEPIPAPDTATLISLLPSKALVEELVEIYITYIESTLRVIHIPSFQRQLSEMWAHIDTPDMVSAAFVAQLLLILASSVGFLEAERLPQTAQQTVVPHSRVVDWIRYADKWLENAKIKRPDLTVLQLHCLLVIAKNHQGLNRSKAWLATGTIVKLAMLAGYHRDPDRMVKISPFNKEMRRRIWATIVELDVQVALDRGMPPTLRPSDFDTLPPLNINDDAISEGIAELPRSQPLHELTDTTYQCVLAQSLPLRLKICALMNSPVISCSYVDIQRLDWELRRFQSSLPSWPTASDSTVANAKSIFCKAVLETKLDQALLALHTPFAVEAHDDPLFEPSSRARLDVAILLVSRQLDLHEMSPRMCMGNFSDSTMQACLSILQHIYSAKRSPSTSTFLYNDFLVVGLSLSPEPASTRTRHVLSPFTDSLFTLVERTIDCMEGKVMLVIKGAKPFFILNMTLAVVKSEFFPDQDDELKESVINRMGTLSYNLLRRYADETVPVTPDNAALGTNFTSSSTPAAPAQSTSSGWEGWDQDVMITPPEDFTNLFTSFDWEDLNMFYDVAAYG